jgi:TolB-like protein
VAIWQTGQDAASAIPTIAVLPFDNLGGDPEEEYFADGMTEELIAQLAQFRDLSVIARNSMFTYKGRAVDVRTVGEEMGADYVLEGSVRRSADRIRLTAQLLSASDGKHLWAQSYDRNLTAAEVFALQDDLAEQVAAAVAGNFGIIALSRFQDTGRKPPDQLQSYECVLRSYAFIRLQTAELHLAARNCLERTLSSDSQYASGWAWLTNMYLEEYGTGFNAEPEPLRRARQSLQHAIRSGPDDPTVVLMDARLLYFEKDPRFFERARQAAAANPRDSYALGEMGFSLAVAGSWEEGIVLSEQAIALSRVHPGWYHWPASWKAYLDGNYRDGLSRAQSGPMPGFYWYHVLLTIRHARLGHTKDALEQATMVRETNPSFEANAYEEFRRWFWQEEAVEEFVAGLREAGMNIRSEGQAESADKNRAPSTRAQS